MREIFVVEQFYLLIVVVVALVYTWDRMTYSYTHNTYVKFLVLILY